jgi:hypothetical protein
MSASDMVALIDAKIETLLSGGCVNYRIGEKEYDPADALKILSEMREKYYKASIEEPYEDIKHVAYDHSDFGEDESEYIGDTL